jgi:CUB domain
LLSSFNGPNPTKDDGSALPRIVQFDSQHDSYALTIHYHSEGTDFETLPAPVQSNFPNKDRRLSLSYQWLPACASECKGYSSKDTVLDASLLQPGEWAVLESPGYPRPYCNRLRCKWQISAPDGYRVVLAVKDLATEPIRDVLLVSKFANRTRWMEQSGDQRSVF